MADPTAETEKFSTYLVGILILAHIFFLNFSSRIVFAPLLPSIEKSLALVHAEAASLFLFVSVGYAAAILGSGFLSCRITHRQMILLSATAVGVAMLCISMCNSIWSLRLGLLFLGMASGLYLPSGMATLTGLVTARHWGKAIATHELAPNLSFLAAPLLAEGLMVWLPWRGVTAFLGLFSLLSGIIFYFFGKGGDFKGESPNFRALKTLFKERSFWVMMFLFSLGICSTMGVYTMLPLFLVAEHGLERNWANTLVALSRISGLFMSFFAGWTTDRIGPKFTMSGVFFLAGLLTILLGAQSGAWLVVTVFLQPVIAVCFFPAGFVALSGIAPPKLRNVAVSMTVPAAFMAGGGLIPMGMGVMGDAGYFSLGVSLTGVLIFSGSLMALLYKKSW